MEFPKETLDLIQKTAQQAAGAVNKLETHIIQGYPDAYILVGPEGPIREVDEDGREGDIVRRVPEIRKHVLRGISEIAPLAQFVAPEKLSVWLSTTATKVVLENDRRDDEASLAMNVTPEFAHLRNTAERWWEPRDLIRVLRTTLWKAAGESAAEPFIRTLRSITFKDGSTTTVKTKHGSESLGRDIEGDVKSEFGEIPETIALNVRVYDDPQLTERTQIMCVVDTKPREGLICISPLPGELQRAQDEALELARTYIQESLAGLDSFDSENTAVLLGSP